MANRKSNDPQISTFDFSHILDSKGLLHEEEAAKKEWPELERENYLTKDRYLNVFRRKAQMKWLLEKARMCKVREGANAQENCREYAELFSLLKLSAAPLDKALFYRPPTKQEH